MKQIISKWRRIAVILYFSIMMLLAIWYSIDSIRAEEVYCTANSVLAVWVYLGIAVMATLSVIRRLKKAKPAGKPKDTWYESTLYNSIDHSN